jgi:hypothetical protein
MECPFCKFENISGEGVTCIHYVGCFYDGEIMWNDWWLEFCDKSDSLRFRESWGDVEPIVRGYLEKVALSESPLQSFLETIPHVKIRVVQPEGMLSGEGDEIFTPEPGLLSRLVKCVLEA